MLTQPQKPTSSDTPPPTRLHLLSFPTGEEVVKCMSLWGRVDGESILIQTTASIESPGHQWSVVVQIKIHRTRMIKVNFIRGEIAYKRNQ